MTVESTVRRVENIDGVEHSEPPPRFVLKAMERQWAVDLVNHGQLRLSSFEYYKKWEHPELGDPNEGNLRYRVGETCAEIESAFAVFIFCTSLPDTDPKRLLALQKGYDTIVRVNAVEEFARCVVTAAREQMDMSFLVGIDRVVYDRNASHTWEFVNTLPWGMDAFQKDPKFAHQCEYRFAFRHLGAPPPDHPLTEEEILEEMMREHVHLTLTLPGGAVEILSPDAFEC